MNVITTIRALGPVDARGVIRDPMLRWILILTPLMALLFRFGVPLIAEWLERQLDFDLVPYYTLIVSFIGPITPGIVGTVIGFLLLDQRDDETLTALLVTPLSLTDYLRYRLAVPVAISVGLTMIMFPLAGLVDMSVAQVVASSICAAPIAAMYALFIASFAANKVQGFALAKAIGVLFIPAVIAYFLAPPWQQVMGLVPLYWPLKVFWLFDAGSPGVGWVYAIVGLVYQSILVWLLTRHFARVVRR